ncbi:MAG: sulfur carrier protein ThiS [Desulfovibrio sp.]|nr:sulfur carrier protein ThiS [Desulfovibrio sp.]MBI4961474.1 sulfur carrier protein ThiS [Desulfovibrio sp.]
MKVVINGKDAQLEDGESLEGCLASKGFDAKAVVVELNESIVPKDIWPTIALKEGDRLEVVSFVGGG